MRKSLIFESIVKEWNPGIMVFHMPRFPSKAIGQIADFFKEEREAVGPPFLVTS
jgi:hypothetical protein